MFFKTPTGGNFFPSIGNVFTNESFILVIGERFSLWWKRLLYLRVFFLLAEIITDLRKTNFLDTKLCRSWKLIFCLVDTIFFYFLRHFSWSFQTQMKKYCFLFRAFFPASGNHYLNYTEVYLKLLLLLLATVFFDFSDIFVNRSSFSL